MSIVNGVDFVFVLIFDRALFDVGNGDQELMDDGEFECSIVRM